MSANRDSFERFKQKGLDARRAGHWASARVYLLEAANVMLAMSKEAKSPALAEARRETAERLLDLARDCAAAAEHKRQRPPVARGRSEPGSNMERIGEGSTGSATEWIVQDKPAVRFNDIAGLEDVKEEIRLRMIYPFIHPQLAQQYGIRGGGGVLLFGPPGTGKTMLARATAGEIEATFFRISAADMLSKWVGEAEQNIRRLFDAAAAESRSIIFIDEIEALVPARRDEGSSVMQRVVPQILQGMEGFEKASASSILFMGATNVPWQLDPAVLRPGRFDEKIYIPLPDREARRKILELNLANRPLSDEIDLDTLADRLAGYSGADIRYICDRAAVVPFMQSVATGDSGVITGSILSDAIADTQPSVSPKSIERFSAWMRDNSRS